jgi:hypothetical protein
MPNDDSFLDISLINPELHHKDFNYVSGTGEPLKFNDIAAWRDYLYTFRISSKRVPVVFADQFHVALRIMLFAWADGRVLKAAELMAASALEGSLKAVYYEKLRAAEPKDDKSQEEEQNQQKKRKQKRFYLADYLEYAVQRDNLSEVYPYENYRGKPNALNVIRNGIAHGYPYSNMPCGGLLETVRDIMEHAFRGYPECFEQPEQIGDLCLEEDSSELNAW